MKLHSVTASGDQAQIELAAMAFDEAIVPEPLSVSHFNETDGTWLLTAHFDQMQDLGALTAGLVAFNDDLASIELRQGEVPDEDWVAKSLEGLPAISAGRFFVFGEHLGHALPPGRIPIHIEAGQAFGTGHHGTTEGCLRALSQIARNRRPERVLDLGTGSGVLAIAAAKLWRSRIIATDIDPISVNVAHENAKLNGVQPHVRAITAAGTAHAEVQETAPYDLIIANILARPLRQLAGDITAALAPGGLLILSGIMAHQAARVEAVYRGHHTRSQDRLTLGEWVTLICRKA